MDHPPRLSLTGEMMTKIYQSMDCNGQRIGAGDRVVIETISEKLLSGLPVEDQVAIAAQVGKLQTISAFDRYGHAEIEFVDDEGLVHTIWIEPTCLRRQPA